METPEFVKPRIISVSQLNYYVKSMLDNDARLMNVFVTGEISNLTDHYRSGHIYFSLKDERAVVRAVMFAGNARNLRFRPEEGMKVIARGRVSLYEPTGGYQIYIEDMQPDGIGALTMQYEQLKKKLEQKGIFAAEHKKPIPKFPKTVGVITSPTGAAVQDIRNIITRRYPSAEIVLCPVLVQGNMAPGQLINAVNLFNEYDCADVIIIGRGGGSIEDLWAFNDENLAYAIYASNIPVISAVGHETDFTICDFVSDLRAPTPSAAAELAVPDVEELRSYFDSQCQYLSTLMDSKYLKLKSRFKSYESALNRYSPAKKRERLIKTYELYAEKLRSFSASKLSSQSERVEKLSAKLEALNPKSVLSRGFSYTKKDNRIVNSVKELKPGDEIIITLSDGEVKAIISGE
ncbi:MAG: exodeoxyribonuclease VII large subunit [Ruminococcus sp.]|nr:exodeoxyribonuclease VII large subunit [Ruminococcus sp.]